MNKGQGRPSKYKPEYDDKALEYLERYEELGELVPTVAGLAMYLGVARSSVNLWAIQDDKPGFSEAFERIKTCQEIKLVSGGLGGAYNSAISKLMLHNHGYSEKTEVDNKSSDGSMSPKEMKVKIVKPGE
jgi:hypothetical protein